MDSVFWESDEKSFKNCELQCSVWKMRENTLRISLSMFSFTYEFLLIPSVIVTEQNSISISCFIYQNQFTFRSITKTIRRKFAWKNKQIVSLWLESHERGQSTEETCKLCDFTKMLEFQATWFLWLCLLIVMGFVYICKELWNGCMVVGGIQNTHYIIKFAVFCLLRNVHKFVLRASVSSHVIIQCFDN